MVRLCQPAWPAVVDELQGRPARPAASAALLDALHARRERWLRLEQLIGRPGSASGSDDDGGDDAFFAAARCLLDAPSPGAGLRDPDSRGRALTCLE
jgi:hypothetical protein